MLDPTIAWVSCIGERHRMRKVNKRFYKKAILPCQDDLHSGELARRTLSNRQMLTFVFVLVDTLTIQKSPPETRTHQDHSPLSFPKTVILPARTLVL